MERILSNKQCGSLIAEAESQQWERVDRYGKYHQTFINNSDISDSIKAYFDKEYINEPIFKVIRFQEEDSIPTFSADYSNREDDYYKRYVDTNFIIQVYLNSNFEGGILTKISTRLEPKVGYGIIQNKTDKCSISKVSKGTAYFLFVFISKLKTTALL